MANAPTPNVPMMATTSRPRTALARRRKRIDLFITVFANVSTVIGLFFLAWLMVTLIGRGAGAFELSVFTTSTAPPGSNGGLLNAIVGTLIQTVLGTLIGAPIGLLVGTYLAEYARNSALGNTVRFVSDILLSAPSILIGLFVYQLIVINTGGFSGWAGVAALAIIVIPVVVRTTEDMLRLIPDTLREAAMGLGSPKWVMIRFVCYRAAMQGIITGVLLAVARIAGETAPLLFTSLGNLNWSVDLNEAMPSLPITIYQYAASPYDDWIALAWVGALIITAAVLGLNIIARYVIKTEPAKK